MKISVNPVVPDDVVLQLFFQRSSELVLKWIFLFEFLELFVNP
ncbi:hypothetical protein [Haloarcula litorea]|nr:hypothetical protein [Halomicroarcula sp. GDY20]